MDPWREAVRIRAPFRSRPPSSSRRLLVALVALIAVTGCGDDEEAPATPPHATVSFEYVAPTATDPRVAAQFASCVTGIERTHLHPSWRGFARIDLIAAGDRWTVTVSDVPVGVRHRFRINDPNVCPENPTGAVTRGILANGVPLTGVVETPGPEPGLAFTVAADGTVTP